jgi:hypothetical protein
MLRLLALILLLYSVLMLAVHLASWRLGEHWARGNDSWANRWLPPRTVLRGEALYWALALGSWPLWSAVVTKVVVAVFALIHIVGWLYTEVGRQPLRPGPASPLASLKARLAVAVFDYIEAFALLGVTFLTAAHLILS